MTDNADLRAAAQAATPGPWFNQGQMIHGPDQGGLDIGPLRGEVHIYEPQNAAYIALASPDRILAICEENERLRRMLFHLREGLSVSRDDVVAEINGVKMGGAPQSWFNSAIAGIDAAIGRAALEEKP